MVTEQMAYEHSEDLRREARAARAAGGKRIASRRAVAAPSLARRLSATLHLRPSTVGCQA